MSLLPIIVCLQLSQTVLDGPPVRTLLGDGQPNQQLAESVLEEGQTNQPFGLVVGPDRCVYVCEVGSHTIRRIDSDNNLVTVFGGNGKQGYTGNGGPAVDASMNEPYEVRFAANGDLFVVEMQNHIVRKIKAEDGTIHLVAGSGRSGFSGDGGPATQARLNRPHSIALDREGNLYICDIGNHRIRKVDHKTGTISTLAGTGQKKPTPDGATLAGTPLHGPRALDVAANGDLILALREGNQLWKIDMQSHRLKLLAGTGRKGFSMEPVDALTAELSGPKGVAVAQNGDIYFADTESHSVRVLTTKGQVKTVIGNGKPGDGPDGRPNSCRLNRPHGIYVSTDGTIFVGDSNNHRVRTLQLPN